MKTADTNHLSAFAFWLWRSISLLSFICTNFDFSAHGSSIDGSRVNGDKEASPIGELCQDVNIAREG